MKKEPRRVLVEWHGKGGMFQRETFNSKLEARQWMIKEIVPYFDTGDTLTVDFIN